MRVIKPDNVLTLYFPVRAGQGGLWRGLAREDAAPRLTRPDSRL